MMELENFIKEALEKRVSKEKIKETLINASWQEKDIDVALDGYADVDFPIPVPRPRPYLSARDAFMYLVLFMTLYVSAFNIGSIFFSLINRYFKDVTRSYYGDYNMEALKFSLAAVVIAFPIFIWLTYKLNKETETNVEKRNSKIRKWLTYLTLFITVAILIGDLITFLFFFLDGELTMRFVLKVLVVLIITGSIFWYYKNDLKRDE